jgi:MoxR-like ATPase
MHSLSEAALCVHRLVTLTGVGGVGKTRLATEVAARLGDEFPYGVWFFDLAAVAEDGVGANAGQAMPIRFRLNEYRPFGSPGFGQKAGQAALGRITR